MYNLCVGEISPRCVQSISVVNSPVFFYIVPHKRLEQPDHKGKGKGLFSNKDGTENEHACHL